MRDLPRDAHFVAEPCERALIGRPLGGKELEGHRLAQQQIVGAVDLAHAAAAQQTHYPVALRQQGSRREAALVHVPGRRGSGTARLVMRSRWRRFVLRPRACRIFHRTHCPVVRRSRMTDKASLVPAHRFFDDGHRVTLLVLPFCSVSRDTKIPQRQRIRELSWCGGGIGISPLIAIWYRCARQNADFIVHARKRILFIETAPLTPIQRAQAHFYSAYLCRQRISVSGNAVKRRIPGRSMTTEYSNTTGRTGEFVSEPEIRFGLRVEGKQKK